MSSKQRGRGGSEWQIRCVCACACAHSLCLSLMVHINICTSGPGNGDSVLVSHLEDMNNANCLHRKGPFPGQEVPESSETWTSQCCTLDSITSHKARTGSSLGVSDQRLGDVPYPFCVHQQPVYPFKLL